jgi:uncharacterized protein (TIGR03066 family)
MPDNFQAKPPRWSPQQAAYDHYPKLNLPQPQKRVSGTPWTIIAIAVAAFIGIGLIAVLSLVMVWYRVRLNDAAMEEAVAQAVVAAADADKNEPLKKEPTNKEKIIGTWELTKSAAPDAPPGVTYEFTKDGKFKVTAKINGKEGGYERTYTVDADKINLGGEGDPKSAKIKKLTETILVLDYGDGATDELKRKKK